MESYEYAAVITVMKDGKEKEILIPFGFGGDEETGKALANQYADGSIIAANPDTSITKYRAVRRPVGAWEEYHGDE